MKRALLALVLGCLVPVIALAIPTINVTPSNLDFGQVDINTTSSMPITVQNLDATDTVYVENIQLYDNTTSFRPSYPGLVVAFSPNYYFMNSSFTANSPIPIPPGESRSINIDFAPGYAGQTGGILFVYWFYSSDHIYPGTTPPSVTFTGVGVDPSAPPPPSSGADVGISVSLSSIDFGQVELGQSRTLQVSVTSTGTDTLFVHQVQFALGNVQVEPSYPGLLVGSLGRFFFMDSNNSNSSIPIPPGESRPIDFTYTPTSAGVMNGVFFIDGNFGGALPMVSYTGEGVDPSAPPPPPPPPPSEDGRVSVASSLDFGDIILGQTATTNLAVGNTGTGDLELWFLEVRGGIGFPSVSVVGATWTSGTGVGIDNTVQAGQNVVIPIQLTPVALGPISGSMLLYTSDPTTNDIDYGNVVTITFTGNVVAPPPPVVVTPPPPPPPPEVPGVDFFCITADQTSLGGRFYLTFFGVEVANPTWDFGDGSTGAGIAPVHFYAVPGEYTVKLVATNALDGVRYERVRVLRLPENAGPVEAVAPAVVYKTGNLQLQIVSGPTDLYTYRARYIASGEETNITIPEDANITGGRGNITAGRKIVVTRYTESADGGMVAVGLTVRKGLTVSAASTRVARSAKITGVQSSSWGAIKAGFRE